MHSIFKKGKSILNHGLEPYEVGKENCRLNIPDVEEKALKRFSTCSGCADLEEEPIDFLKVSDERIKGASEKMCGQCGCSIPYLLRQDLKMCKKWGE